MKHFNSAPKPLILSLLALTLGAITPTGVLASGLPAWAQNTEVMINAEGADMTTIGRYFGPDNSSTLNFTTSQNVANETFSYALNSGSTYLGQPASLSGTGYFDNVNSDWVVTSNGTIGSQSWSTAYLATVTGDPTLTIAGRITIPHPGLPGLDIELTAALQVVFPPPPLLIVRSVAAGQLTVGFPPFSVNVGPKFGVFDSIGVGGGVIWATGGVFVAGVDANGGGHDFMVATSGMVPPNDNGGAGTLTSMVQSVPEPSSVTLLGLGVLGLIPLHRWTRTRNS